MESSNVFKMIAINDIDLLFYVRLWLSEVDRWRNTNFGYHVNVIAISYKNPANKNYRFF